MLQNPDENPQPLEGAVSEALEGETLRSDDWKRLASALQLRQERLERDLAEETDSDKRANIEAQLEALDEQILALQEEAGISRFIEETVKFSYEVRRLSEG